MDTTDYSYGRWVTYKGERFMILDARTYIVEIYLGAGETKWVSKRDVSEVSDFLKTDAERKALGYSF